MRRTLTTSLVLLSLHAAAARGELAIADGQLLEQVAKASRANFERVRTWQGEIRVDSESTITRPGREPLKISTVARVEFISDNLTRSLRTKYLTSDYTTSDPMAAAEYGGVTPVSPKSNAMVHEGAYYRYNFDEAVDYAAGDDGPVPIRRAATVSGMSERNVTPFGPEIDPYFWFGRKGETVSVIFDVYHQWAKEGVDLSHVDIEEEGALVMMTVRGTDSVFNAYTVDRSKGTNLVRYRASDGPGGASEEMECKYVRVDGLWVPSHVVLKVVTADDSRHRRELTWTTNAVNQPIAADAFTLAGLGLRRGDRVQNHVTGESYLVAGPNFPPARPKAEVVASRWLPTALTFALVACLACAIGWRRFRGTS